MLPNMSYDVVPVVWLQATDDAGEQALFFHCHLMDILALFLPSIEDITGTALLVGTKVPSFEELITVFALLARIYDFFRLWKIREVC